ncbi:MAG: hypothetical protein L0J70_11655, partial [Corynebacterium sp.]|nr:hypothetical protein [Corynebacterium sp.]
MTQILGAPGARPPRRTTTTRAGVSSVAGVLSLVLSVVLVTVSACTPRPDVADDVVGDFLDAVSSRDVEAAARLTDDDAVASDALEQSWD